MMILAEKITSVLSSDGYLNVQSANITVAGHFSLMTKIAYSAAK